MAQKTYYDDGTEMWSWWGRPPADEPAEVPADDVHTVKWGYNLADLDQLSHACARRAWTRVGYHHDRHQAAYDGIVVALLSATERPTPEDLVRAGSTVISSWAATEKHHHGVTEEGEKAPRFATYWASQVMPIGAPENSTVERVALWQIWSHLTDSDRRALLLLATTGTYEEASAAAGVSAKVFRLRVYRARKAFLALWHEHETPARIRKHAARRSAHSHARLGYRRITEDELDEIREKVLRGHTYKLVAAEYGVSQSTVSALLRGKSRPAPPRGVAA